MDNDSGHILVIDDHRTNCLKMSPAVQSLGHTTALAEDGRQAVVRGESLPGRAQGAAPAPGPADFG